MYIYLFYLPVFQYQQSECEDQVSSGRDTDQLSLLWESLNEGLVQVPMGAH